MSTIKIKIRSGETQICAGAECLRDKRSHREGVVRDIVTFMHFAWLKVSAVESADEKGIA